MLRFSHLLLVQQDFTPKIMVLSTSSFCFNFTHFNLTHSVLYLNYINWREIESSAEAFKLQGFQESELRCQISKVFSASKYSRSLLQWHPGERPKSVTGREWLILCHCKQLNFTIRLEIGKSEKCHLNQMALYCVTVSNWILLQGVPKLVLQLC